MDSWMFLTALSDSGKEAAICYETDLNQDPAHKQLDI